MVIQRDKLFLVLIVVFLRFSLRIDLNFLCIMDPTSCRNQENDSADRLIKERNAEGTIKKYRAYSEEEIFIETVRNISCKREEEHSNFTLDVA